MNTLRTVFAFVVLVIAIAFVSASWVLTRETSDWKKRHDDLKVKLETEIAGLNKNISDLTSQLSAMTDERNKWMEAGKKLETTIGEKDLKIEGLNTQVQTLEAFKKNIEDEMRAIREQLATQTTNNTALAKERDELRDAKDAAEKAQRDAEDKQRMLENDVDNLRAKLKLVTAQMKSASDLNARYAAVYGDDGLRLAQAAPAPVPVIIGTVTNVDNPMRLVSISVGKDDGVSTGMQFEVVRTVANQYVGRVRDRKSVV